MSFADFPDQQKGIELLRRSLDRGRLSHAYLFGGGSLDQLEGIARTLAKTLNCHRASQRGVTGLALDCCDQCVTCRKIDESNHADVQWLRPESKSRVITIAQIRDLMQTIFLKPLEADWKVAVIVAADRLNVQAANAFLKTLEEPPARSIVLLLSTEQERLLETISSRCQRLTFAGDGGLQMEQAQVEWLSRFSETAARGQASLLGRYKLLGVLLTRLTQIKAETEKSVSSQSPLARHQDIEPQLREKWEDELASAVEAEYRRRRGDVLSALEWWLRDVWMQKLKVGEHLLAFPVFGEATFAIAERISARDAANNIEIVEGAHRLLGSNVQEALALEVSLLRLRI